MKIAVIFLLLGVASFIETSNGLQSKLNPLPKDKAQIYVRCVQAAVEKAEHLKKCPEPERKTREVCLAEDLIHTLKLLAMDLGCTLNDVFELLELPLDALNLLKLGKITELLSVIQVDKLLISLTRVVEALLAQIGILLKGELISLIQTLGSTVNILVLTLHNTLGAITTSLVGTVLGAVTGLVAVPLGLVGSVVGGLGGILNVG
ncbi:uncharacterized protein LOC120932241 [Rana temporaria]|uniref:uncharacterized protein LOC120932241 n=1 Tax=Rana temporaria TaxID=8407 RepID=UPI001AACCDB3|nr:uncharacterized protein LOC120932241 [Rana temporaria]